MKLSLLLLLVAFLAAAFSEDAPADCSVVLCPANTVCQSASFDCEGTVCPQVACVAAPKVLDPCVDAVCPQSTVCLPEPKQCVTTPCPQYRCLSMNEYVCATSICTESTRCVPSPKQCFTTPCPQYDCVPLDDSSSAPSDQCTQASCGTNQVCLSEPKQCFTTPCPQYACLNKAECPDFCPEVYQPVCGSNDKTYPNLCKLRAAMCLTKTSIYVQHDGECTAEEECTTICPANYAPVCGSDGVTYSNQCSLGVRACQSKAQITVAHVGECADCNIACTMEYAPVCGSDDHTYSNLCALKVAACKAKAPLSVKAQGECQVAELPCPQFCPMNFAPVCGSDGITYSNICKMQVAACNLKATIEVAHDGECTAADSPCNAMCTEQYEPVCGSNLETFSNKCFFEVAKCRAKSNMFVLHAGQCRKDVWDSVSLLDSDGNGAVSLEEFASTHPEMTSAEINAAFSSSDRDKDGNLTPNDFSASAGSVGHASNRPAVVVGVLAAFIGGIALAIAGYMYMKQQKRSRAQENLASSRNVGANNFSKEYEAFDDSL